MPRNRIVVIALVLGVGGALLTSCGDDVEALSKPEFIEQANAICQIASDEAEPLFETVFEDEFDDLDQDEILVRFAELAVQIKPIWQQMTDDIRDLAEPDEDRDLIETLMDDFDAAVDDFEETAAAAADGDQAAIQALDDDDNDDPFDDLNRRAREYGLTVCGEDS